MSDKIRLLGKVLVKSNFKLFANTFPMLKNNGTVTIRKQVDRGDIIEIETEEEKEVSTLKSTISVQIDNKDEEFSQDKLYDFILTDLNKGFNAYLGSAKELKSIKWFSPNPDDKWVFIWHKFLVKIGFRSDKTIDDLEKVVGEHARLGSWNNPLNKSMIISPRLYFVLKTSNNFKNKKLTKLEGFNDVFIGGEYNDFKVFVNPLATGQDIFFVEDIRLFYNDYVTLSETEKGLDIDLNYLFEFSNLEKISLTNY